MINLDNYWPANSLHSANSFLINRYGGQERLLKMEFDDNSTYMKMMIVLN